jgi:hypothetical protein
VETGSKTEDEEKEERTLTHSSIGVRNGTSVVSHSEVVTLLDAADHLGSCNVSESSGKSNFTIFFFFYLWVLHPVAQSIETSNWISHLRMDRRGRNM